MAIRRSLFAGFLLFAASASGQTPNARSAPAPLITGLFPAGASCGADVEWTLTGRGFSRAKQLIGLGRGVQLLGFEPTSDTEAKVSLRVAKDAPVGYREIRVEGIDGISNLVIARIDNLAQVVENEPNDAPNQALEVKPDTAVAGILLPTDIDHVRVKGTPGRRLTIDLEARRLGTAFSPVVTASTAAGVSIAQGRERPGGDRDCRFGVTVPPNGIVVISIRDNVYGGGPSAAYRLRVDTAPAASGLFPLGGPKGATVEVEVGGGTLIRPATKKVALPNLPAPEFDLGLFETPEGAVSAPMRFLVGDENEVFEPAQGTAEKPAPIRIGQTVNGRIAKPGEVDRFRLAVKKGERLRLKIQAAELGSWIDSVVTIRSAAGDQLAENDDEGAGGGGVQGRRVNALGLTEGSQDSLLEYTSTVDGEIDVEVADRYGEGGPEYAYRLLVGRSRPDFSITLLLGNPNAGPTANVQAVNNLRLAPGMLGVFNLRPGSVVPVNFVVSSEGSPGPVVVSVEGLPGGVTVDPVKVQLPDVARPNEPPTRSAADALVFRVASYADPGVSEIKVVGKAQPKQGPPIVREATATVGVQRANTAAQSIPITRIINAFPLRVLGELRPRFVGPPLPPRLTGVTLPGVLLQGDRIDLQLEFEESPLADSGFEFEAVAEGVGLATNTVISSGQSSGDEETRSDVLVRVLASAKAAPGVYPVTVKAKYTGGRTDERTVVVVVRQPLQVLVRPETHRIKPGGAVSIPVFVRREPGCDGEIDLKVEELPRGAKLAGPVTLGEGQSEGTLKIEMAPNARPLRTPREIRIVAVARMPRGAVSIECPVRPMIAAPAAED